MLLAIDPSIRCAGWALFGGTGSASREVAFILIGAGTIDQASSASTILRISRFVALLEEATGLSQISSVAIELPQIYPGPQETPADDVIAAAAQVGAVLQGYGGGMVTTYRPHDWKGQVEKQAHNERVLSRLRPCELAAIPKLPKSKKHNMVDAIGIGLHHLGRLEPRHASLAEIESKGLTIYRRDVSRGARGTSAGKRGGSGRAAAR